MVLEELVSGGKVGWRRPLLIWTVLKWYHLVFEGGGTPQGRCLAWTQSRTLVWGGGRRAAKVCLKIIDLCFSSTWPLFLFTHCTIGGHRFGRYHHGLRIGWWWEGGEHRGGWLGGRPGHLEVLLLSRHLCWLFVFEQVFIYPDMKTAISGTFSEDGRLVAGSECEVDLEEKTF